MIDKTTGAMQKFETPPTSGNSYAGLILLYAENFQELPAVLPLATQSTVIGRDNSADIILPVSAVSRRHAEISFQSGAWTIRDLGSRNGTIVDGNLITSTALEAGSEVRIGDAIFRFVDQEAENYAGYRIDGAMLGGRARQAPPGALVGGYQVDALLAQLARIAETPLSVLILGESGTGKEVAARELHRMSGRSGDFCAINCAAIPGQLLESELFGYKRGAFSGADRDKPGLIKVAHHGTLLLDEIGDMPLEAQAKLLRVLQAKEVFPLGATAPEQVDVRIMGATHGDLVKLQSQGKFRPDLYARLNEYQLRLPPLRERKEDIFLLCRTLLQRHGGAQLQPSFAFMLAMTHYDWPYNVRELEACMKRCVALQTGPRLDKDLIPTSVQECMAEYGGVAKPRPSQLPAAAESLPTPSRAPVPNEAELRELLRLHQGNIAAVGRQLNKARMQIHRWIRRYDIRIDDYRK